MLLTLLFWGLYALSFFKRPLRVIIQLGVLGIRCISFDDIEAWMTKKFKDSAKKRKNKKGKTNKKDNESTEEEDEEAEEAEEEDEEEEEEEEEDEKPKRKIIKKKTTDLLKL